MLLLKCQKGFLQNNYFYFFLVLMEVHFTYKIPNTESQLNLNQDIKYQNKSFEILSSTCCKSSLSDFSWATSALMQPFIEHRVACNTRHRQRSATRKPAAVLSLWLLIFKPSFQCCILIITDILPIKHVKLSK